MTGPATMLGRLAEGDRAPCTSTLVACPPGCGRPRGGAVARSSSSVNRPITRQARSVRALHALRCDAGGPLSVHYWRMSTHTTSHRPDNRRRSPHPGSAGDEDPAPGRSTMAEVERLVAEKRGCPACRSLYPDLAAEAARVADQLPELDALLEARARAARETVARISREARTATGEAPVGEETAL